MHNVSKPLTNRSIGKSSLRQRVSRWLAAPVFPEDAVKTHQASVLKFLLQVSLVTMLLLTALDLATYPTPLLIGVELICITTLAVSLHIIRRGHVQAVSIVVLVVGLVALTLANVIFGTVHGPSATGYLLLIVISSLLFDTRGLVVTVIVSGLCVVGLLEAEAAGLIQPATRSAEGVEWLNLLIWMAAAAGLSYWGLRTTRSALARAEQELAARRAAEAALVLATAQAEAANRAKSQFLASMSHELRTPLNAILGYAQILQRDPTVTEHQTERLKVIEQSGAHLLALINDVLDMARIEAGKIELAPEDFALPPFLASVNAPMRVRAELKGLRYRFETTALPATVHGDARRLRQILLNLLGNAIKFTDRGEVAFRVEQMDQSARLRFTVSDTGIGIAPEQLAELFKPFVQVGDSQRRQEGAGLGLAISHELAQLMGGALQAQSSPGQGSAFWFEVTLPIVPDVTPRAPAARRIVGIQGAAPLILIVDDQPENRAVVVDLLAPLGFQVIEAGDGREGLVRALAECPAALITDLVMPAMDGFELIRQVRRAPGLEKTLIIAASASVFEEDQRASHIAGSHVFLPKPVQAEQLLAILQQHLGLTWQYADGAPEPPVSSAAPFTPPAPAEIARLLDMVKQGDIAAVQQAADQLEKSDPALAQFGQELRRLAASFDLHRLRTWLAEQARGEHRDGE
jgi:signal transduction histidine kinase/ActR/RegA family two-component response regulator